MVDPYIGAQGHDTNNEDTNPKIQPSYDKAQHPLDATTTIILQRSIKFFFKATKMTAEASEAAAAAATAAPSSRSFTLYFIRHGEALHNRIEKLAESAAIADATSMGHDATSDHVRHAAEEARRKALESAADVEDPPLSESGLDEARCAKRELERLIEAHGLPRVEEVWVSPLQRAMQTAGAIFPESFALDSASSSSSSSSARPPPPPKIRVRKEIEERKTGLACDRHTSYENIVRRLKFKKLSISCLKLDRLALGAKPSCCSLDSEGSGISSSSHDATPEQRVVGEGSPSTSSSATTASVWEDRFVGGAATSALEAELRSSSPRGSSSARDHHRRRLEAPPPGVGGGGGAAAAIEDKSMLRERTKKLFHLLAETDSRSICLIGHKGYLRELERGPLGNADAELFRNCEVRVYRLELDTGRGGCAAEGSERTSDRACDIDDGVGSGGGEVGSDRTPRRFPVLQRAEKVASSIVLA